MQKLMCVETQNANTQIHGDKNAKYPPPLPLTPILYHEAYTWGLHYPCIVGWLLLRTFNFFNFHLVSSCSVLFTGFVLALHIWRTVSKLTARPLGLIETKLSENTNWAKTESFGFGKHSFFPRRSSCLPPEDQQRKRNSACFWCWSEWQRGDPVITQDMSYEGAIPEWMGGWQGASPTSPHQGLGHPLCHQPPPPKLTKWPNISPQHHQVTKHISK